MPLKLLSIAVTGFLLLNAALLASSALNPLSLDVTIERYVSTANGDYSPGTPTPCGRSGAIKLTNRSVRFALDVPGVGPAQFVSTEDAVLDDTGTGSTHGLITVHLSDGLIVKAKSTGKIYPVLVGDVLCIGFDGRITTVGASNEDVAAMGTYAGYFQPDDADAESGRFHMQIEMEIDASIQFMIGQLVNL
jgi:hypothetical protein